MKGRKEERERERARDRQREQMNETLLFIKDEALIYN